MRSLSAGSGGLRTVGGRAKWLGRAMTHCIGPIRSGYDVLRLFAAAVLLAAGALKAYQLATEPVIGSGWLDNRWLLMATVEFELFFAIWLLGGNLPRLTWAAALICFGLFACVSLYKALSGHVSCGCFGRVPVNPWYTAALDLGFVLSLLRWRPKGHWLQFAINFRQLFAQAVGVLLVWLSLGLPAAFVMGSYADAMLSDAGIIIGNGRTVVLEPEKWAGKRFPLLPFIEDAPGQLRPGKRPLQERLGEGNWIVLLYHHDCPRCQKAIPEYQKLARRSVADPVAPRVALIEVPSYGDVTGRTRSQDVPYVLGRLNREKEWFVETPACLVLHQRGVGLTEVITVKVDTQ